MKLVLPEGYLVQTVEISIFGTFKRNGTKLKFLGTKSFVSQLTKLYAQICILLILLQYNLDLDLQSGQAILILFKMLSQSCLVGEKHRCEILPVNGDIVDDSTSVPSGFHLNRRALVLLNRHSHLTRQGCGSDASMG